MNPAEYDAFRALVALRMNVPRAMVDSGTVRGNGSVQHGLTNIAITLSAMPREQWPMAFDEWLRAWDEKPTELDDDAMRATLRLRLCQRELFGEAHLYAGPMVAQDLQAAYVLDLPDRVRSVKSIDLPRLATSDAAIYALARENTAREPVPTPETIEMGTETMYAYESDNFFVASQLLRLDAIRAVGPHGALAIVPSTHFLGVVDIATIGVLQALQFMAPIAQRSFDSMAHPCSPSVYWWRTSGIEKLQFDIHDGSIEFKPSDDLIDVLNALAGEAQS